MKYAALLKQRAEALAESERLRADESATVEQLNACTEKLTAVNENIAAFDRLAAAEAKLPATKAAPHVTVTPRVEQDPKRGFASIGDFARAVAARAKGAKTGDAVAFDERLAVAANDDGVKIGAAPTNFHQEGHSAEGFMVPPEYRNQLWRPVFESDELLALVNPEPTESNSVQFLRDETTPWGSSGITAGWIAEGGQMTAKKLATKGTEIKLHKVYAFVLATEEVLADAALLTSRINERAPEAIGWTVAEAVMRGTGAGQPKGWENGAVGGDGVARISIAKETAQAAATIVAKNLTKMYARLLVGPGSRPGWLANRDIVPELVDLKIGNEPSWTAQNQGLRDAPAGGILGIPVRFSEHCKTLGTSGDIQLVDFAGFAAYIRSGGTRFDSSIHLYFDYDIQSFRWTMRVGGQPLLSAPVSPANGSNTKSHFVYLDTRA
jgi:HK97 family phage major capsid protein